MLDSAGYSSFAELGFRIKKAELAKEELLKAHHRYMTSQREITTAFEQFKNCAGN
jgi:hypothetical protein